MAPALKKIAFELEPSFEELKRDTASALRVVDDVEQSLAGRSNTASVNKVAAMLDLIEQMLPDIHRASEIIEDLDRQAPRHH